MSLRLVPFNPIWITHEKMDMHAIYRRPRFVSDDYGELIREVDTNGLPTWDLTGGLPVKAHNRWTAKGFEYVTLSNRESLLVAANMGTLPPGTNYRDFDQHHVGGPWNYKLYAEGRVATDAAESENLRADVERFGAEAVEALRKRTDPNFRLPDSLKQKPALTVQEIETVAVTGQQDYRTQEWTSHDLSPVKPKKRMGRPKGSKNKPPVEVPA